MSGPKDFRFAFSAARLERMRAINVAMQQSRITEAQARLQAVGERNAAAVLAELARNREAGMRKIAATERAAAPPVMVPRIKIDKSDDANSAGLDQSRGEMENSLAAAREALGILKKAVQDPNDAELVSLRQALEAAERNSQTNPSESDLAARDVAQRAKEQAAFVERSATQLIGSIKEIEGWREELTHDLAVQQFQHAAAEDWETQVNAFRADLTAGVGPRRAVARGMELVCLAKTMHAEAGVKKGQADARNALLRDIIVSLQEIGFFVSDPFYENPSDPSGCVIVKATRGGETMTASLDLSDLVRSVWDGIPDERCKDSFFDYVEQMKRKDVVISPERADLRSPPILKQRGAKDLPRADQRQAGS